MSQSIESPTHHITAIASDPQWYLDFYTQVLGFRLVKRTVNFDDPGVYILTLNRGDQSRKHRKRRSSANVSGTTSDLTPMTAGSLAPFLVLGAGVGFAGGLFAIGGALIVIPLLTAAFALTQHDAHPYAFTPQLRRQQIDRLDYANIITRIVAELSVPYQAEIPYKTVLLDY
jgi:hypothetical protein